MVCRHEGVMLCELSYCVGSDCSLYDSVLARGHYGEPQSPLS